MLLGRQQTRTYPRESVECERLEGTRPPAFAKLAPVSAFIRNYETVEMLG